MAETPLAVPLVLSIGWALVHFVWQGTLIGLATAIGLRGLAGAGPTTRYVVACAGLAVMLAAPVLAVFSAINASTRVAEAVSVAAPSTFGSPGSTIPSDAAFSVTPRVDDLLPVAVVVWVAGVSFFSLRLVAGSVHATRLKRLATRQVEASISARALALSRRLGLTRSIRVLESAVVRVPTVVGCLRPVILLPMSVISGLPATHLESVIAHELAHVRRHDYLVNAAQAIVETLLFYHPVVWWCSRQIRIEREHCCDDLVVQVCGDRVAYASALADLEQLRQSQPALSLSATGGRLVDRVRRLLTPAPVASHRATAAIVASALTLILVLVVSSSVRSSVGLAQAPAATPTTEAPVVPVEPAPPAQPKPAAPSPRAVAPATPQPLAVPTVGAVRPFAISPDGRWVAYRSDELGRGGIYVRPLQEGVPASPPVPVVPFPAAPAPAPSPATDTAREWSAYLRETQDALRVLAEETGGIAVSNQRNREKAPAPPELPAAPAPPAPVLPVAPTAAPLPPVQPVAVPSAPLAAPPSAPAPVALPGPPAPVALPLSPVPPQAPLPPGPVLYIDQGAIDERLKRVEQARAALDRLETELAKQAKQTTRADLERGQSEALAELRTSLDELSKDLEALRAYQRFAKPDVKPDLSRIREQLEEIFRSLETAPVR